MKYISDILLRILLAVIALPFVAAFCFIGLLVVNFVLAIMVSIMMLKMTYNILFK